MKRLFISLTLALALLAPASTFAVDTTQPATPSPAQPAANTEAFVPLTQFPQIQALAEPNGFAGSLNTIYRVLVGAGAVLAVIMIMIAGGEFMTNRGSVSTNEKAKNHIRNAIFGLILVLAPTIVFSIINPDILNIDLGKEFESLKPRALNQDAFTSPSKTPNTVGTCSLPANSVQMVSGDKCPTGTQPIPYGSADYGCCSPSVTNVCCKKSSTSGGGAQPEGGVYGWRTKFVPVGSPENYTGGAWYEKGPFQTSQECNASQIKFIQDNQSTVSPSNSTCACNTPMSQQPGCRIS